MIVLLFGPPGCGKGTQSPRIQDWLNIPLIATGDMLRQEIRARTRLGRGIDEVLATGGYVGDSQMNRLLLRRTSQPDCSSGYLIDGYPRTVAQAIFLERLREKRGLPSPIVIHLRVAEDMLLTRLSGRRQCAECKRVHNIYTNPPRREGLCDCGVPLEERNDDRPEVVRARLQLYAEQTNPVLDYYGSRHCHTLDGMRHPDDVFGEIQSVLEPHLVRVRARHNRVNR
ncbi:MAG: nucleoside monophosphate kinase [Bryobacteraceae bacterium]|nr:nucleoside monophosphate kinase [Bryobacteraceae bacterium]